MYDVRILLVSENNSCLHALREFLQSARYDVSAASSPEKAAVLAGQSRPDLVLMDVSSGCGASAADAAAAIAARWALPVLCLAGASDLEAVDRPFPGLPVSSFRKPYQEWDLMLAIKKALGGRAAGSEEALRKSEERYLKLVEATASYLYTVVVDGGRPVATKHGPGCVFVTGYTSEEYDADPELWYRMVHEDDRGDVLKQIEAVLAGACMKPIEHRIVHKNGAITWVRNTPIPRYNGDGRLTAYDGLITCIAQERALKDQLHQAQKMEAVGQLAGGIAHDFNNILTAIIGFTTLVKMRLPENDSLHAEIDQILRATDRAAKLTERLLSFSRKQTSRPRPVKIDEVVQQANRLLDRVLGEDIRMKTVLAAGDLTIMSDAWQLEQILINLATNARDAMPVGGELVIETGSVRLDQDFIALHGYGGVGRYVCITVADSGCGMDEETKRRIFEPFFTTKEVGKGTGLGLAIVYGIVKQHRGYINVYSEPGQGTTFRIYLPVIADAAVPAVTAHAAPLRGRETVLLAEDDGDVRRSTKCLLESYGYRVIEAPDGAEAVAKFREHESIIDMLILDIVMPKKTGKEAFEEIRQTRPDIKAIFTSGYAGDLVRLRGVAEQDWNFVSKPILPAEFTKKIRDVLAA